LGSILDGFGAIWEHFWSLGAQFCQGPDASKSVATGSALCGTTAQQILIFLSALPVPMLRQVYFEVFLGVFFRSVFRGVFLKACGSIFGENWSKTGAKTRSKSTKKRHFFQKGKNVFRLVNTISNACSDPPKMIKKTTKNSVKKQVGFKTPLCGQI